MIEIPYEFTGLNQYLNETKKHWSYGYRIKKKETDLAKIMSLGKKPIKDYPVKITMTWIRKDKRMDLDNLAFAKKMILDGMVQAKILENDSIKYINAFEDKFGIGDKPKVIIEWELNDGEGNIK